MGDIADMILEDMELYYWGYDPDWYDGPTLITCKYCGERGLTWSHGIGGWLLLRDDGEIHNCLSPDATVDEFPDLKITAMEPETKLRCPR